MQRKRKEEFKKWAKSLDDEKLVGEYYEAVLDCLGSQVDRMYELGYDIADIEEREEIECDNCVIADILEVECYRRGIELWKK